MNLEIQKAVPGEAYDSIALMVKSLLEEIMGATGGKHFNIDLPEMSRRCKRFLEDDIYVVYKTLDREHGIGAMLVNRAMEHGTGRGWKRLEVATPPLPHFNRTVKFYERQNFEVTGGKKLRVLL